MQQSVRKIEHDFVEGVAHNKRRPDAVNGREVLGRNTRRVPEPKQWPNKEQHHDWCHNEMVERLLQ
jgi:hypothetical protein